MDRAPLAGRLLALAAALALPVAAVGLAGEENGAFLPVAVVFALLAIGPARLFLRRDRSVRAFRVRAAAEGAGFLVGGLLLLLAGGLVLWPTGVLLVAAVVQPRDDHHVLLRALGALAGLAALGLSADLLGAPF